jgi:D-alanine-D-alanine ligase
MSQQRSVAVLAGGLSHERDVSLRSGRQVTQALRDLGYEVVLHDVDDRLLATLEQSSPDCVIPMLHGSTGEDGSLRDVLEALSLAYVGSRPDPCRLAFDKMVARAHLHALGFEVSPAVSLPHATFRDLGAGIVMKALQRRIGLPMVVKPNSGGSALGVSLVRKAEELPAALIAAFAYGGTAMLERLVEGTEVSVCVVEDAEGQPRALPPVEIDPDAGHYDFASRYSAGATQFFAPARLAPDLGSRAQELAVAAHDGLGLRHLSRCDFIIDAEGRAVLLQVNVAPGCTETSLLPQAIRAAGETLGSVFATLIKRALAE